MNERKKERKKGRKKSSSDRVVGADADLARAVAVEDDVARADGAAGDQVLHLEPIARGARVVAAGGAQRELRENENSKR